MFNILYLPVAIGRQLVATSLAVVAFAGLACSTWSSGSGLPMASWFVGATMDSDWLNNKVIPARNLAGNEGTLGSPSSGPFSANKPRLPFS